MRWKQIYVYASRCIDRVFVWFWVGRGVVSVRGLLSDCAGVQLYRMHGRSEYDDIGQKSKWPGFIFCLYGQMCESANCVPSDNFT